MSANYSMLYDLTLKDKEVVVTWLVGIAFSTLCILAQLLIYIFCPGSRRIVQNILTQLSLARLANTIVEFLTADKCLINSKSIDVIILTALYLQTDAVLVCWMFCYTKYMYNKIVQVFNVEEWRLLRLSLAIWFGTLPLGLLYPLTVKINVLTFETFQKIYGGIKFGVLLMNLFLFCKIFYVIAIQSRETGRNFKRIIKSCAISFLLVCITSLQVAVTDFISSSKNHTAATCFGVINSYQVLAISILFVILSKNSANAA